MTAPARRILAFDPGGRETGLCVRHGSQALSVAVVARVGRISNATLVDRDYLRRIDAAVDRCVFGAGCVDVVAIEGVNAPTPHMGVTNPSGVIAAAVVVGWLLARHTGAVLVAPGGHGAAPLAAYPPSLVGARETGVYGTGVLRHARAAYDVAAAAAWTLRVDGAA